MVAGFRQFVTFITIAAWHMRSINHQPNAAASLVRSEMSIFRTRFNRRAHVVGHDEAAGLHL